MRCVALAAAVVAVVAACGSPARLDGPKAEARIGERLAATYDVEVDAVSCPDDVEVDAGGAFTCEASIGEAGTVSVDVHQTDDEGTLEVESRRAIISTARVEADIAATLADRFERDEVEVTCEGPAVRLEAPDATFTCEAVDGDESKQVDVRVRDARGALAYTLRDDA